MCCPPASVRTAPAPAPAPGPMRTARRRASMRVRTIPEWTSCLQRLLPDRLVCRSGLVLCGDERIEDGHDEQREHRAERHAGDKHHPDAVAGGGTGAGDEDQW